MTWGKSNRDTLRSTYIPTTEIEQKKRKMTANHGVNFSGELLKPSNQILTTDTMQGTLNGGEVPTQNPRMHVDSLKLESKGDNPEFPTPKDEGLRLAEGGALRHE